MPQCKPACLNKKSENECKQHGCYLGNDKDLSPVKSVSNDTYPWTKNKKWDLQQESNDTKCSCSMCQFPHNPGLGGLLHPITEQGNRLPEHIHPDISNS